MKKQYIAPDLTIVSLKVERGYAASESVSAMTVMAGASRGFSLSSNDDPIEERSVSDKWDSPNDFWSDEER